MEKIWKTQWKGKLHFSHGSNHSCGVMILVRSDLDFNLISINSDDEGRSIVMEAEVQGSPFLFVNVYAPNKTQDQCCFFDKLNDSIEDCDANKELTIIGHLQDPVTRYRINYTETQRNSYQSSPTFLCLKVPLRHLRPSVIYSVPCDRILQRAYSRGRFQCHT